MSDLLQLARDQLASPGPHSSRIACWLTRSALEDTVDHLLDSVGVVTGDRTSARSKLTCLEAVYEDRDVPARAHYAWARLSEACHHHAYELAPTHAEAAHLLALVESLVDIEPGT